ncbi:ankyrin repeat domain-containing protein [Providencia rustigianii]|uniref:ankyrin repeat domain-containing protein n=1 Tax=Providencia rustigianii TaxID=158850 RepID=UPI0038B40527
MPLSTTLQTIIKKDELSLIQEGLNLYIQNPFTETFCSVGDKWSPNITKEDFLGSDAQNKDYLLALLSRGAYYSRWQEIHGIEKLNTEQINQLGITAELLSDNFTGFQANICRFNNLYILCFAGTNDIVDFYANIRQGLGYYEPQYFQAVGLTNILYKAVQGNIICTGHSLGGGLASIAGLASQSPCISFSPAGLAQSTVQKIGMDYYLAKKMADNGLMRFYTVQYDWLDALQNTLPIPPALGNRIKMAYSEQSSWKDWLPHRLLTRSFIAHTMVKITRMMCKYKPWNNWNAITGEFDKQVDIMLTEFPTIEEQKIINWQESCKNAIKQGNINEFSTLLSMNNKQCNIDSLAMQSVRSVNSQFIKVLLKSSYGKGIQNMKLAQQKSILHIAAQSGQVAQSEILLHSGIMVNVKDSLGNTPLHDALNSHALEVAELLLSKGADWRMKNNQGDNCRDILSHHMIKETSLTDEGRASRGKIYQMMS